MPPRSPFPPVALAEALQLARAIYDQNSGKPMLRMTLFNALNKSPESSTSRSLVTASSSYGLTIGGYKAESISLTSRGMAIVAENDPSAMLEAALEPKIFQAFFQHYENSVVPTKLAAMDFLGKQGVVSENREACLDILLQTGRYVGLIQTTSGKERVLSQNYVLGHRGSSRESTKSSRSDVDTPEIESTHDNDSKPVAAPLPIINSSQISPNPSLHIDIQIHISSDASVEQIDQIFFSMAKHLYGRSE